MTNHATRDRAIHTYAVGDVQGCLDSFERLLGQLPEPQRLIFVGDTVNRGPQSLGMLRAVKQRVDSGRAVALLGNHDLHLLATDAGVRPLQDSDTVAEILAAPDRRELIDWLRAQPLAHREAGILFVHGGVPPQWSADEALSCAAEVGQRLAQGDYRDFLKEMYGNKPNLWSETLRGDDRLRFIVNALTRLRVVDTEGRMYLKFKGAADQAPAGTMPWFDHPQRATRTTPIVFGHWSTAGLVRRSNVVGLDTGCVWGGKLTALRLGDGALFQVDCPPCQAPDD